MHAARIFKHFDLALNTRLSMISRLQAKLNTSTCSCRPTLKPLVLAVCQADDLLEQSSVDVSVHDRVPLLLRNGRCEALTAARWIQEQQAKGTQRLMVQITNRPADTMNSHV